MATTLQKFYSFRAVETTIQQGQHQCLPLNGRGWYSYLQLPSLDMSTKFVIKKK